MIWFVYDIGDVDDGGVGGEVDGDVTDGASEGLPMKQGAPISPSFTISSEDINDYDDAADDDDGDDAADDDDGYDDDDDGDGCILAATNLCLSHLAFTADQRRKRDYI